MSKPTDKHLKINITVPAWMLPKIDRAAREMHMTRSAFFRWAAEKKMRAEEYKTEGEVMHGPADDPYWMSSVLTGAIKLLRDKGTPEEVASFLRAYDSSGPCPSPCFGHAARGIPHIRTCDMEHRWLAGAK